MNKYMWIFTVIFIFVKGANSAPVTWDFNINTGYLDGVLVLNSGEYSVALKAWGTDTNDSSFESAYINGMGESGLGICNKNDIGSYSLSTGLPTTCSGFSIDATKGFDLIMMDFNYVATDRTVFTFNTSFRTGIFYGIEYYYGMGDAPNIEGMSYLELRNNYNYGTYNYIADSPLIYGYANTISEYEWIAFMPNQKGSFMLNTGFNSGDIRTVPIPTSLWLMIVGIALIVLININASQLTNSSRGLSKLAWLLQKNRKSHASFESP